MPYSSVHATFEEEAACTSVYVGQKALRVLGRIATYRGIKYAV